MRHRSQEKLRGEAQADTKGAASLRLAARWLRLGLLAFGALACGEDPAAPAAQAPATLLPDWAQRICQDWQRPDGSCDQTALIADYQECRTQGTPEQERLQQAGAGNRLARLAGERKTNLCLELRHWVMTEEHRRSQMHRPKRAAPPS